MMKENLEAMIILKVRHDMTEDKKIEKMHYFFSDPIRRLIITFLYKNKNKLLINVIAFDTDKLLNSN